MMSCNYKSGETRPVATKAGALGVLRRRMSMVATGGMAPGGSGSAVVESRCSSGGRRLIMTAGQGGEGTGRGSSDSAAVSVGHGSIV